jgi:hypothetical protein
VRGGLAGGGSAGAPGSLARIAATFLCEAKAIVFDGAVEEPEERRRFLVGKVELHPLALRRDTKRLSTVGVRQKYQARVSNNVSNPASTVITAASSAMGTNFVAGINARWQRPNPAPW